MESPAVSVLLTSYKHERYLRACVDSALAQTYANMQVIVVDDNSPDSSAEILKSYGDKIQLALNKENRGTYGVLNQALSLARGEYCAVLNSDDLWAPEKIARQVQLMQAHDAMAFCHTYGDFIDGDGRVVQGRPMGFEFPRTETGDELATFIANNTAIASSVMFRTEVAERIGGFDESYRNLGDWDMWLRLAAEGNVGFVDEKLTFYRVHGANTIYAIETTRTEEMRLRAASLKQFRSRADSPKMKAALAHTAACLASLHSITGEPKKARALYIESLRLNPKRIKSVLRYFLTFAPLWLRRKTL